MNEEINCVLLTVCSRTDEHGFKTLKESLEKFNWPHMICVTDWKGFGTKLIAVYEFLKETPEITHLFFCDAYDVVVLGTIEEALSKINDKSKMLVGAERGLWPPDLQIHDHEFKHFAHGFNYVNSGLYFAPRKVFMELIDNNAPEYSTDDQKWLTERYLSQKDGSIVLDNNCDVFQNYSFIRDMDYRFDAFEKRITNLNTGTLPVLFHGNGRTDMSAIYELINGNSTMSDLNTATEAIKKLNEQPFKTQPSKKYCMDLASKIPYNTLDELIGNAEKINKYLTEVL